MNFLTYTEIFSELTSFFDRIEPRASGVEYEHVKHANGGQKSSKTVLLNFGMAPLTGLDCVTELEFLNSNFEFCWYVPLRVNSRAVQITQRYFYF